MSLNPRVIVTPKVYSGPENISGEFSAVLDVFKVARNIADGSVVQPGGPGGAFSLEPSRGLFIYLYDYVARTHGLVTATARRLIKPSEGSDILLIEVDDFIQAVTEYETLVDNQHRRTAEDLAALGSERVYVKRLVDAVVTEG